MTLGRDLSLKAIYNLVRDPDKANRVIYKHGDSCSNKEELRVCG